MEKYVKIHLKTLILRFNSQEIIAILGAVLDGETRELILTWNLPDGTAIEGKDCVLIKKKHHKKKEKKK